MHTKSCIFHDDPHDDGQRQSEKPSPEHGSLPLQTSQNYGRRADTVAVRIVLDANGSGSANGSAICHLHEDQVRLLLGWPRGPSCPLLVTSSD
jgi:hypothetical protein